MSTTTGARKIVDTLMEAGVDHVFGIPGGATGPIYDAFYGKQGEVKVVLARHEQSAAIMADVHGRLTGRPALLMGQGPFIATSGGFGIAEAYLSYSPMLIITDVCDIGYWQLGAYQNVSGEYGTVDVLSILRSMTKYTTLVDTANEAVLGVTLAAKHASSGPHGPAAVLMRSQASVSRLDLEAKLPSYEVKGYLSNESPIAPPSAVQRVAEALGSAERPAIIAGKGVRNANAYQELRGLAELLASPVATTYKGRSSIEETHPLAVGPMGAYGIEAANAAVGQADVVLVVGSRLRAHDTAFYNPSILNPERQRIFQVDIEPRNSGWTVPVELGLIGDAKEVIQQIAEVVGRSPLPGEERERRVNALAGLKESLRYFNDSAALHTDKSPVPPQRLVRLIQESVDPSTIITLDAGNNRLWMHHFYQCQGTGTMLGPGGHGGMGWSIPAAVGAKIVRPDLPVMAVTGDGGFMMTSNAISTAVQYGAPIVIVVFNDGALGMVREHQRRDGTVIASEFADANHASLCKAYGGWGVQVSDSRDVPAALHDAFGSGLPSVVDVIVDGSEEFAQYRPTTP